MHTILKLLFLMLFAACGNNSQEEMRSAIDVALTHLSHSRCDDALSALGEVDHDNSNAIYLQVLASAHACQAGFNEVSFIATDLADLDTSDFNSIMTSLAKLTLSEETEADSVGYSSIKTALNFLLQSTAEEPSQVARTTKFGSRKAGDMGVQSLILSLVNLGKFLNYYGNVNANGEKGKGTVSSNKCFLDYTDGRAQLVVTASGGICASNTDGHPDLSLAPANETAAIRRLCEGLLLITNTLDILDNIDLSSSSTLSKLEDISTQVAGVKAIATTAGLGDLINMTSQSTCEEYLETPAHLGDMQYLYSLLFETGLQ